MIKHVSLRYFRKHEALDLELSEGLQAIRGSNEAGKTTILESIGYALFGSKALANTFDEVVTYGHKPAELKVELIVEFEGVDYVFKRSKSGAEVVKGGEVFVTGQNEMSAFAAKMLGADLNSAAKLMIASQGDLRGALDAGPKATSEIIEALSDLDVIEKIIEKAQEKWQLGSTAVLVERLKGVEAALADLGDVAAAPDAAAHALQMAEVNNRINDAAAAVCVSQQMRDAAAAAFTAEYDRQQQYKKLQGEGEALVAKLDTLSAQIEAAEIVANVAVEDPSRIEAEVREAEVYEQTSQAWAVFSSRPDAGEQMDRAVHAERTKKAEALARDLQRRYNDAQTQIKVLKAQQITSDTCPSCGQDISKLPHIAAKKLEIESGIAAQEKVILSLQMQDEENDREIAYLKGFADRDAALQKHIRPILNYVAVEDDIIPPNVAAGPNLILHGHKPDLPALRKKLAEVKAKRIERDRAAGRLEALEQQRTALVSELAAKLDARDALKTLSVEDYEVLNSTFILAEGDLSAARSAFDLAEIEMRGIIADFEQQQRDWKAAADKRQALIDNASQIKADIEQIDFNTSLLKKVRGARPIIASKLWGLVLNTVSTIFSNMRGELSVVTREKDGFYVNGKPAYGGGLSGSAKDILGLAIRCALVKTFIPQCPFVILDEPTQGCDADRAAALTGFVAAAGFRQSILVTHSDVSEAGANNLIQL